LEQKLALFIIQSATCRNLNLCFDHRFCLVGRST